MRVEDLFNKFPREVGYPRRIVNNVCELKKYVELNNGIRGVYVSLYDLTYTIDKFFFDFDSVDLNQAFEDVKLFINRLEEYNYPYIPVFSGRKGFHVYVLVKPWTPVNIETARAVLRDVQYKLAGGIATVDRHVFGDVKRLTRYPNTLNKSNYCVPLPHDFVKWTLRGVIDYAKEPRVVEYDVKVIPGIDAYIDNIDNINYGEEEKVSPLHDPVDFPPSLLLVKPLLRPCVFEAITTDQDPPHIVRMTMVCELMYYGWSKKSIHELIKKLKWRDYDSKKTQYQINHIFKRSYLPPSCYKLKHFVKCTNCGWFYFYNSKLE